MRRTVPAGSEIHHGPGVDHTLVPAESVTVKQMIESFTRNGACAGFQKDEIGTLEVGRKADFSLLDQNILEIDPAEVHNTTVLLTNFEGSEVYRS